MGRSIEIKIAATILAILGVAVWLVVLAFRGISVPFTWEALKAIPEAAGYVGTVALIFAKWAWKIPIFQGWLVLVPNLNGTWKGKMRSLWIDPQTGATTPPFDAYLVIRQSLLGISCILLTHESRSISRAATVLIDDDHQLKALEFTYSNSPRVTVQFRSMAHDGASLLDIISKPKRKLIGKYWTDRVPVATKGEMDFSFHSKKFRETFAG